MAQTKLLTQEYPLVVLPQLAKKLGTNAAILLQQIHYWTSKRCGSIIDGVRWIYNTYQQWQEQLPFLSVSTIKRVIAKLKDLNLILVEQHDKSEWNHRNYYRIDYESLKALASNSGGDLQNAMLPAQLSIGSNCTEQLGQTEPSSSVNLSQSSISTEITSETTTHTKEVEEKDFSQEAEKLLEKYDLRLKTYAIYRLSWSGDKLVPNPKMKPVLQALALMPPERAERSILAFLGWFSDQDPNKIKDKYKALASAIARNWGSS